MVAQNYAEQCVFEHNADRVSQQSTFTFVGENLAATTGPTNYTYLVMLWYDEIQDYNFSSNTCAQGGVCGHYTQVATPILHDHTLSMIEIRSNPMPYQHVSLSSMQIKAHGAQSLTCHAFFVCLENLISL